MAFSEGTTIMESSREFYFYVRRALPLLQRNPLLAVMMVYAAGICMAVSIAALAASRESPKCHASQRCERPHVVHTASSIQRSITFFQT
jgi:hypothetical protein